MSAYVGRKMKATVPISGKIKVLRKIHWMPACSFALHHHLIQKKKKNVMTYKNAYYCLVQLKKQKKIKKICKWTGNYGMRYKVKI